MGFDVERFESAVDSELICSICNAVLENPQQIIKCEHAFCRDCISQWLEHNAICPIDRQPVNRNDLKQVPRIMKNLLGKLLVSCEFQVNGCLDKVPLELVVGHQEQCNYNPKKPVQCEKGCDLVIPKDQIDSHNCVRSLHMLLKDQHEQVQGMHSQIAEYKMAVDELRRQMRCVRECFKVLKTDSNNQRLRELQTEMENEDINNWVQRLPMARVTRWGGMISTPDSVLQSVVKRALIDSGCPMTIVQELMVNSHERRWPHGLATLETRQLNRQRYHCYNIRKIPERQAVVVVAAENQHMPDDMIVNPGLVMIFAHGVE